MPQNLSFSGHREVPLCFYEAPAGAPIILFSPGYGGARTGYGFLARHWADRGYAVAVLEHLGSNQDALTRLKAEVGRDFPRAVEVGVSEDRVEFSRRLADVRLARSELERHFPELDWTRLGLAGHSYGSATVASLAPEWCPRGVVLLSPPFPGGPWDDALPQIQAPTLFVTGTRDNSLTGSRNYEQRLETFRRLTARPRYLAVFQDAEHLTFAGIGLRLERWLPSVRELTARFWESCLTPDGGPVQADNLQAICRWEAA